MARSGIWDKETSTGELLYLRMNLTVLGMTEEDTSRKLALDYAMGRERSGGGRRSLPVLRETACDQRDHPC